MNPLFFSQDSGDRLRIQVAAVNLDDRKIDFVLAPSATLAAGSKRAGGRRKG